MDGAVAGSGGWCGGDGFATVRVCRGSGVAWLMRLVARVDIYSSRRQANVYIIVSKESRGILVGKKCLLSRAICRAECRVYRSVVVHLEREWIPPSSPPGMVVSFTQCGGRSSSCSHMAVGDWLLAQSVTMLRCGQCWAASLPVLSFESIIDSFLLLGVVKVVSEMRLISCCTWRLLGNEGGAVRPSGERHRKSRVWREQNPLAGMRAGRWDGGR